MSDHDQSTHDRTQFVCAQMVASLLTLKPRERGRSCFYVNSDIVTGIESQIHGGRLPVSVWCIHWRTQTIYCHGREVRYDPALDAHEEPSWVLYERRVDAFDRINPDVATMKGGE